MTVSREDVEALRREKYANDPSAYMSADISRLANGEPLAYVIGTQPFLGLSIYLDSHPLIPRPETEWWTELLIERINSSTDTVLEALDMCAGSGAIGLALLAHCPNIHVSFGEIENAHLPTIQRNLRENALSESRATVCIGNLFEPFEHKQFHIIATNPPYVPDTRTLESSVSEHEPERALFAGPDGLAVITEILQKTPAHLYPQGELWMECDIDNIEKAKTLALSYGSTRAEIHTDPYGRPRLLVAYY
jgi:release factor glutamine methyltransferase